MCIIACDNIFILKDGHVQMWNGFCERMGINFCSVMAVVIKIKLFVCAFYGWGGGEVGLILFTLSFESFKRKYL